jgi:hypothetical protein
VVTRVSTKFAEWFVGLCWRRTDPAALRRAATCAAVCFLRGFSMLSLSQRNTRGARYESRSLDPLALIRRKFSARRELRHIPPLQSDYPPPLILKGAPQAEQEDKMTEKVRINSKVRSQKPATTQAIERELNEQELDKVAGGLTPSIPIPPPELLLR